MATHVVVALQLNLRSAPDPAANNRIAVLPQGTPVTKVATTDVAHWWEVEAELGGTVLRGFVNSRHLGPKDHSFPAATGSGGRIPPADLGRSSSAKRSHAGAWAFAIGENGRPGKAKDHPDGKAAGIRAIIDWLNVEKASHLRWKPSQFTYCNIYTYDVCTLAGCYIPRVWWTSQALIKLKAGQTVEAKYGVTVNEMAANYIFNWLVEFGEDFGWKRVFDLDVLQAEANQGRIGIICAQRTQMNRPGHIQIIPSEKGNSKAKRNAQGQVTQPLQSQAGARNFNYDFLGSSWWRAAQFRDFGFWTCEVT